MRRIIVEVLGVCLLGLAAGCGGSQQVEMPTNPTPPPKNSVLTGSRAVNSGPAVKNDQSGGLKPLKRGPGTAAP